MSALCGLTSFCHFQTGALGSDTQGKAHQHGMAREHKGADDDDRAGGNLPLKQVRKCTWYLL
jgi:hypothetical protein